jgi:uncharacterized membrane protein
MDNFQQPQQSQSPQPITSSEDIATNKGMATLSYFGIFLFIPLLTKRDSPYVWFHLKQGIVFAIISILWAILSPPLLAFIGLFAGVISLLGSLGLFIPWIIGIVNALSGKMKPLPLIGDLANLF